MLGSVSNGTIPLTGTGYVNGSGDRIIGVTMHYAGSGLHPVGTALIVIPADVLIGTYSLSFSGDGAPNEYSGVATIVPCV